MRRLFILIALLSVTALFVTQTSRAQNEVQLGTLEINLWPEYDQPNMLIIYKITLPPDTVTTSLTFHIPKAAGEPYKVASKLDDGQLYLTQYSFQVKSGWGEVTLIPDSNEFQIEYYDPRLEILGSSRSFSYTWPGDYAVSSAAIVIQQPLDANNMQFTPPMNVSSFKGVGDNLLYFAHQIGTLGKGQTYNFTLSYQKSTNTLTWEKLKVSSVGKLPQSMWDRGLPWALGVLALLLIAGGVWVYWRSGRPQAGQNKRTRRKLAPAASGETTEDSGVYCHSCGRRASASDVFCRSCGTKLRI